jgi:hypothetical protein
MTRCQAATLKGLPCKNAASPALGGYCHAHGHLSQTEAQEDTPNDSSRPDSESKVTQPGRRPEREPPSGNLFRVMRDYRLQFMLATIGVYTGALLAAYPILKDSLGTEFSAAIFNYLPSFVGILIVMISMTFIMRMINKRREETDSRFIDVDERRRSAIPSTSAILRRLDALSVEQTSVDYDRIREIITETDSEFAQERDNSLRTFSGYFERVVRTLEEKASDADEKASILLDKGTRYSRWGIAFYLASIVVWQVAAWFGGYRVELVYGVVSCSFLFAFIEFLSAWFLRQYRHFVDTSTYLIKVKSLFDRYLLAYLVAMESVPKAAAEQQNTVSRVIDMLSSDIKWPDTQILRRGDISFAKEAIEAMSGLAQHLNGLKSKSDS